MEKLTVYQILQELKNTNSSNEKLAILDANKDNDVLKQVFLYALSPRIKFYIKKIPDYITNPLNDLNNQDNELIWAIEQLKFLYTRFYTGNSAVYNLKQTLESISKNNSYIIERIIDRDLKCGVNTALVNKTWRNLIPETPYMGCKPYSKKLIENLFKTDKKGVVSQCLSEDWEVEDEFGNFHKIKDVVENRLKLKLKSFNFNKNVVEYNQVVNYFYNGVETEDWYSITYEDENGNIIKSLPLTSKHKLFLLTGESVSVEYLKVNDIII